MSYQRATSPNGLVASIRRRRSGDDVGEKLVLDLRNAVLEDELLFFQSLDKKLVSRRVAFKGHDFVVELPMLGPEVHKLFPELALVASLHSICPYPTNGRSQRFGRLLLIWQQTKA